MGEYGILSAGNGPVHKGRRQDGPGADLHGHHLGKQQLMIHGVQVIPIIAGLAYAKAPAAGNLAGNLGDELQKTGPELWNLVVLKRGGASQTSGENRGNLHNLRADRQGFRQVGQQMLVCFGFLADDDIQTVFR